MTRYLHTHFSLYSEYERPEFGAALVSQRALRGQLPIHIFSFWSAATSGVSDNTVVSADLVYFKSDWWILWAGKDYFAARGL